MNTTLRTAFIVGVLLALGLAAFPAEDQAPPKTIVTGQAVSGAESYVEVKRSSKFFEYRDVPRDAIFPSFKLSVERGDAFVRVLASRIRQDDGRYWISAGEYGRFRADFTYDRIPHRFSFFGQTLFVQPSAGLYTVPDELRSLLQNAVGNGAANSNLNMPIARAMLKGFLPGVHDIDLGLQRNRYTLSLNYRPGVPWTLNLTAFRERRDGSRPFGTSFGFSNVLELPEPIHYTTSELNASAEYSRPWGTLQAGCYVSLFDNEHESLTWDNPYRLTDQTFSTAYLNGNGAATGRTALPPSNSALKFYFNGTVKLLKLTWIHATASYGTLSQNAALLPYTTNTAIAADPAGFAGALLPPRATAQTGAHITNFDLSLTSRIVSRTSLTLGFRYYDFANATESLDVAGRARFDQVWEVTPGPISLYAFNKAHLYSDLRFDLLRNTSVKLSYSYSTIERSQGPEAESGESNQDQDREHALKIALDSLPLDWASFRVSYVYSDRRWELTGKEFFYAPFFNFGRYYNANRIRQGLNVLAQLSPFQRLDIALSGMLGKDRYPKSDYGLKVFDLVMYGLDLSYALSSASSVYGFFAHERYRTDQSARESNADVFSPDPGDDWSARITDTVDTYGLGTILAVKKDVLVLDLSYSYSKAVGSSFLSSPAGGLYLIAPPVQYTRPLDETGLETVLAKLTWRLSARFALSLGYWYERYAIRDIVRNDAGVDWIVPANIPGGASGASSIYLGAIEPRYIYHVGSLSFICNW